MAALLEESRESNSITTLQQLPNEIQRMILTHLSLYDLYKAFSGINSRFNSLVYHITPKVLNTHALNEDIQMFERHFIWYFSKWIWWEEYVYYIIPFRGFHSLRWKFIPQRSADQLKEVSANHHRILPVISKYPVHFNTLFLIWNVCDMKELYFLAKKFPQWMVENYSEQNKIIIDSDSRWYTKEVCDAFREINKLERERQQQMIYEQAKKIWNELRESDEFLISDLSAFPKYGEN